MSIIPPPGENRRLRNINNLLKHYKEPDIPDKMIKKIKKKFPELKNYIYLHPEEVETEIYIQIVDLNLNNVSDVYKCIRIDKGENNNIKNILFYNESTRSQLKINPANYYLFKVLNDFEIQLNDYVKIMEKINNK
jgi:hypothetical protein